MNYESKLAIRGLGIPSLLVVMTNDIWRNILYLVDKIITKQFDFDMVLVFFGVSIATLVFSNR